MHIDSHTETKILEHAKKLWFLSAMPETIEALNSGRLKELNVKNDNGIIVIQGRASAGMNHFFGQDNLPVIMGDTRIAELIMLEAHYQDHAAKDIILSMSHHTAWVVNDRKLATKIYRSCAAVT